MNVCAECITVEELTKQLQDDLLIQKSNMRIVYVDDSGEHHPVGTVSPVYSGETETVELSA